MQALSNTVCGSHQAEPLAPALHSPLSNLVLRAQTKTEVQPDRALLHLPACSLVSTASFLRSLSPQAIVEGNYARRT